MTQEGNHYRWWLRGYARGGGLREIELMISGLSKREDFGGTWYWNRYPGASCDIESYVYFPL